MSGYHNGHRIDARQLIDVECRGRWFDLLQSLGGLSRIQLSGKHGPCPVCGGRDRFRWVQSEERWVCNHCTGGSLQDGVHFLQTLRGWDFKEVVAELQQAVGSARRHFATSKTTSQSQQQFIDRIWHGSEPIGDSTPVALYLRSRGIEAPRWPPSLRYHPKLKAGKNGASFPAMIARIDRPDGSIGILHRTFLTVDGQKANIESPRMMFGKHPEGGAVRIGKPNGIIGVTEGLETALSAALHHKHAVWAALTAGALLKWSPPEGPTHIRIFGDNDANYTGQSKAYALANRLAMADKNRIVEVLIPGRVGTDWNDAYGNPTNHER